MNIVPPLAPESLEQSIGLFRLSRMIFAAASLRIAEHLAAGSRDAAALARETVTHEGALASLMDVLSAYGVFARGVDGRYSLTDFSKRMVPGAADSANVRMLLGWAGLPAAYDAFGDLLHTLRTGRAALTARNPGGFYGYLADHPESRSLYEAAMESTAESFAACVTAYNFSPARTLVDVGGGQGAFATAILKAKAGLTAIVFDLPAVVASARSDDPQVRDRLRFVPGDAMQAVPEGADVYVTSTVLRCFDDEGCERLLRNIRAAMPSHGRLAAFEMVAPEGRDQVAWCTADLVARVIYGGRDRCQREFDALFARAGLQWTRTIPVNAHLSVMEAVPTRPIGRDL